ncbi:MAG: orotidine-5'-phosphate decarboxylase [Oscillospiraceae bacterium]|jgi:orotidine-5'-phosphate decarboxylase|nr:orotidine-5'-phosphate decarboxylase [Oscillospiraceae bacterium]
MDKLISRIEKIGYPVVAGLDPLLDYIPAHIKQPHFAALGNTLEAAAAAILDYNKALIDALADVVPAVKPQCAYYEQYGWQGVRTLAETIAYAQAKGLYVITDGKRNDIGSTMEAYAAAHLGTVDVNGAVHTPFGADALTVNGYLGSDGVRPALKTGKDIFVLCKTSNPSSGELQDQSLGDKPLYAALGDLCEQWGAGAVGDWGYSPVGAVVGATYPAQLRELRVRLPHTFFLVPGYGAQGGTAADIAGAFDQNGRGAIVNSSRAILTAWKKSDTPEDFAGAARAEALRMGKEIQLTMNNCTL